MGNERKNASRCRRRSRAELDEHLKGEIQTNLYQYMIENEDKVMHWLRTLAKTPTCKGKFTILEENSHMDGEDLVQETYTRVLKTFYDNEQRLKACSKCTNPCKEFTEQTRTRNTEKCAEGRNCRPYMFYHYDERKLHNYMNCALKQNIDNKLMSLTNKDGVKIVVKTEDKIGSSDDGCELGEFLADNLGMELSAIHELEENLLNKKILFINKLDDFETEPYEFENEVSQFTQSVKDPFMAKVIEEEVGSRFDLIPVGKYQEDLDQVLTDRDIKEYQYNSGESMDKIELAESTAKLDMLECMPDYEDMTYEMLASYYEYLQDAEYEDDIPREYTKKNTEIKIVDKDYKIMPLPLYSYAEVSVRDFLELYADIKEGIDFFKKIDAFSKYTASFKETWIDFENKAYNIMESAELSSQGKQRLYWLERFASKVKRLKLCSRAKRMAEIFSSIPSWVEQFAEESLLDSTINVIKQYAIDAEYGSYVNTKKMRLRTEKRKRIPLKERMERAEVEMRRILDLREKIENKDVSMINTSEEDTLDPNLKDQELFKYLLSKIPTLETKYITEVAEVLCTNQSNNIKNVVSV
jgi:hypothetical protein